MYYIAKKLDRGQVVEIARIKNGLIFGPEAELVKKALLDNDWPKKAPNYALYSDYLWVDNPILEKDDVPQDGWVVNEDFTWEK